jgi:hypothetical protein
MSVQCALSTRCWWTLPTKKSAPLSPSCQTRSLCAHYHNAFGSRIGFERDSRPKRRLGTRLFGELLAANNASGVSTLFPSTSTHRGFIINEGVFDWYDFILYRFLKAHNKISMEIFNAVNLRSVLSVRCHIPMHKKGLSRQC